MEIGKAFGYVFEDEHWVRKVIIGGLLMGMGVISNTVAGAVASVLDSLLAILLFRILGFIGLAVVEGYRIRTVSNVSDEMGRPLPRWGEWGGDLGKGALYSLALAVYMLPAIIMGIIASASIFGQLLRLGWVLLAFLWMPAVMICYAKEQRFGAMFDVAGIWLLIRNSLRNYVLAIVLAGMINIFLVILALALEYFAFNIFGILFLICLFSVFFWLRVAQAHLWGQVGRCATGVSGQSAAPAVKPPAAALDREGAGQRLEKSESRSEDKFTAGAVPGSGYDLVLVVSEALGTTAADEDERGVRELVQQLVQEGGLVDSATVKTFSVEALPDPEGVEAYVRMMQMRLGIGLVGFHYEFRQSQLHRFLVVYMKQ